MAQDPKSSPKTQPKNKAGAGDPKTPKPEAADFQAADLGAAKGADLNVAAAVPAALASLTGYVSAAGDFALPVFEEEAGERDGGPQAHQASFDPAAVDFARPGISSQELPLVAIKSQLLNSVGNIEPVVMPGSTIGAALPSGHSAGAQPTGPVLEDAPARNGSLQSHPDEMTPATTDDSSTPTAALNDAPSLSASDGVVLENASGAVVGSVTASDQDVGDWVT
ncbi:MAG: hypothetical protein ACR2O2_06715, partial [Ruegeria sp.]